MHNATALFQLHTEVDARVSAIRAHRPDWPCSKGCDNCCRQLAAVPRLTATEWDVLKQGLQLLNASRLQEIRRAVAALPEATPGPVVCPMLERESGACPVYAHRPVACRSYGFYVQRDKGLYCAEIEASVAQGELADVVWGNHDAIDRGLMATGESRSLIEWFGEWPGE